MFSNIDYLVGVPNLYLRRDCLNLMTRLKKRVLDSHFILIRLAPIRSLVTLMPNENETEICHFGAHGSA